MRELRIYQNPDDYEILIYDQEKDGSSEEAMWTMDKILYEFEARRYFENLLCEVNNNA